MQATRFPHTITLLFVLAACTRPVNEDREFDKVFQGFVAAKNNNDYEALIGFLPKEMFDKFTREDLVQWGKNADKEIGSTTFRDWAIDEYGPIVQNGASKFRRINYHGTVVNKTNSPFKESVLNYLKNIYGQDYVSYDSAEHAYVVKRTVIIIAIKSNDDSDWKILEHNPNGNNEISERIVPHYVLEQVLSKKSD